MSDRKAAIAVSRGLLKAQDFDQLEAVLGGHLKTFPGEPELLKVATSLYRALRDHEKSLLYAGLLIDAAPGKWNGYVNAAQALASLKRLEEARCMILRGFTEHPCAPQVLIHAYRIFRVCGSREESLEYAKRLIIHCPCEPHGYIWSTQDMMALGRYQEARSQAQDGLSKFPDNPILIRISALVDAFNGIPRSEISKAEKKDLSLSTQHLIAYSKAPDFFRLLQDKRFATSQVHLSKRLLFVTGLPRSGTTALGNMLNISRDLELYKELYPALRLNGYTPQDFTQQVLFERISSAQRGRRRTKDINNLEIFRRNGTSLCIGDKRPFFQFCAESTFDNFSESQVKVIFIDRSLVDICRSSHKKSVKPHDRWSIEHTILMYNASCRQIVHLSQSRPEIFKQFLFPRYEKIFSDEVFARDLFDYASLKLAGEQLASFCEYIKASRRIALARRNVDSLLEKQIAYCINKYLDLESHRRFCDVTGNFRDYCVDAL